VWNVRAISVAAVPLAILLLGGPVSRRFLDGEIAGRTTVKDGKVLIETGENASEGTFVHEMLHGLNAFGWPEGPSIVGAALEYVADHADGTISDAAIRRRVEWIQSEQRAVAQKVDKSTYESLTLDRIDDLIERSPIGRETFTGYFDAAELAGLALSLIHDRMRSMTFLVCLSWGASGRMALKALDDGEYMSWLRMLALRHVGFQMIAEFTYRLKSRVSEGDLTHILDHLNMPVAEKCRVSRTVGAVFRRVRENDFRRVLSRGISAEALVNDVRKLDGVRTVKWYSERPPLFVLNPRPNNDFSWTVPQNTLEETRRKILELDRQLDGALKVRIEIADFPRNRLDDGVVYVQWSNLLPNEGDVVVRTDDHEITAGLITLSIDASSLAVWTSIAATVIGALEHHKDGTVHYGVLPANTTASVPPRARDFQGDECGGRTPTRTDLPTLNRR
jgi:hypothetical protein